MFKTLKENKILRKVILMLTGSIKGTVVYVLGLCVLAIIMDVLKSDSSVLYYALYIFIMLGSFVCAIATCKKVRGRGFLIGVLSSIPYSAIVIFFTLVFTQFRLSPDVLMVFLLSFLGGFLGGVTAVNTRL